MGAEHPDSVEILFANRTSVMNRRSGGDQADIVPRGGIAEASQRAGGRIATESSAAADWVIWVNLSSLIASLASSCFAGRKGIVCWVSDRKGTVCWASGRKGIVCWV